MHTGLSTSYRESLPDVSNEQEAVVFEVAHHGTAAAQLGGSAVMLVVVADCPVTHHRQHVREAPLW